MIDHTGLDVSDFGKSKAFYLDTTSRRFATIRRFDPGR
jgi:hypothetical protein